jgi:hypothetical protein
MSRKELPRAGLVAAAIAGRISNREGLSHLRHNRVSTAVATPGQVLRLLDNRVSDAPSLTVSAFSACRSGDNRLNPPHRFLHNLLA